MSMIDEVLEVQNSYNKRIAELKLKYPSIEILTATVNTPWFSGERIAGNITIWGYDKSNEQRVF
jgi:hypothetical protein